MTTTVEEMSRRVENLKMCTCESTHFWFEQFDLLFGILN